MREIKFRAWDKANTIMLFFSFNENTSDYPVEFPENNLSENEGYVIMQYTGLKDKHGKEGYFDDLVQWGTSRYQVMWNSRKGIAELIKCTGLEVFQTLRIKEIERGIIIGNIYGNPELLKEG